MIFKKKQRNKYLLSEAGIWIRNFCNSTAPYLDINKLDSERDYKIFLDNELANAKSIRGTFEPSRTNYQNIVIVSDGHGFKTAQKLLSDMRNVHVVGVNGALRHWDAGGKNMSYYVVNNPFPECKRWLPTRVYFPTCVASIRTYPPFVKNYKGPLFFYSPTPNRHYSTPHKSLRPYLEDYRNPITSAISMAYLLGVQKLALFCCDDSFEDERPASIKLDNGLYCYPQQIKSQHIIDSCLYWMKENGVEVADCSGGIQYNNATYLGPNELVDFFKEDDNG
jgi:hypothetical protein